MSFKVEVMPAAEQQFMSLKQNVRDKIKNALIELEQVETPLSIDAIRPLTGSLHGQYRLNIDYWRVLLAQHDDNNALYVLAILPKGGPGH